MKKYKVAIIGGGASGLAAAVVCADKVGGKNVILLEKQQKIGRKLLATGNGRCNISNRNMDISHYHGDHRIAQSVLSSFGTKNLKRFFSGLGLLLRDDPEGRMYPYSNQAITVLDCIKNELEKHETNIRYEFVPGSIRQDSQGFIIQSDSDTIYADSVIFACGSKASGSLGSDDSGIKLLEKMGIRSSPLFPALSPVETAERYKYLKGVRSKGTVSVIADGKKIISKSGEIQFTDKGISGICVFECSRPVNEFLIFGTVDNKSTARMNISLDIIPELKYDSLCKYIRSCRSYFADLPAAMILSGALNKKLSEAVICFSGIRKNRCSELDENDVIRLADCAKSFIFTPKKTDIFNLAQVCAGGVSSDEINPETLMSKKINKLYICGEMLNVDGDCGGYNLHFAFGSGILAAKNIN